LFGILSIFRTCRKHWPLASPAAPEIENACLFASGWSTVTVHRPAACRATHLQRCKWSAGWPPAVSGCTVEQHDSVSRSQEDRACWCRQSRLFDPGLLSITVISVHISIRKFLVKGVTGVGLDRLSPGRKTERNGSICDVEVHRHLRAGLQKEPAEAAVKAFGI